MWGAFAIRNLLLALAAVAAATVLPPAALAQESGLSSVRSAEGYSEGCVRWERTVVASPQGRLTQRLRVHFQFTNECDRPVYLLLRHQVADYGRRPGGNSPISLAAGASYGGPRANGNYFFYNPPSDRWLNFWVFQFDVRPVGATFPDMRRCINPNLPDPEVPECPPSFTL